MVTGWAIVRFLHVLSAATWVGGQLVLSTLLLPLIRRRLPPDLRTSISSGIGRRFGLFTLVIFLPVQVGTGIGLAIEHGVTWESLTEPGYGRTLLAKLSLFAAVLVVSGIHGWAHGNGRQAMARALALTSLLGSCGIILLAAMLASH
ncbi:MAG: hypothetical protein IRZ02_04415 [Acidothermus sp.]|nr:hypothetical protein [Acidothermus sp.]MCL6538555.1 hypothetical protein [Acidothermus sp.]